MRGVIRKKDILSHPWVVIQGFGLKLFWQTLTAPNSSTFLELISEGLPKPVSEKELELTAQLDKLVSFELRCALIYSQCRERFWHFSAARHLFLNLSYQEETHAEMIRIVKVEIARKNLWDFVNPIPKEKFVKVEQVLSEIEGSLKNGGDFSLARGIAVVETLESRENDVVFEFLLHFHKAVETPFIRKLHKIIPSIADHHAYLNSALPEIKETLAIEERSAKKRERL